MADPEKKINGEFTRWFMAFMALQEYSFDIRRIRGKSNVTADALKQSESLLSSKVPVIPVTMSNDLN